MKNPNVKGSSGFSASVSTGIQESKLSISQSEFKKVRIQVFVGAVLQETKFSRLILAACAVDHPYAIETYRVRLPQRMDSTTDEEGKAVTEWLLKHLPNNNDVDLDIFFTGTIDLDLLESQRTHYNSLTIEAVNGDDNAAYKDVRQLARTQQGIY